MGEILRYDHVDVSYNGVCMVHDISFAVQSGEILGIAGESGSGKSTLLRAAMGLLGQDGMVTRGDIWYGGKSLPDLSSEELRRISGSEIGMVFQSAGSSFCAIRTVGAQLFEMMQAHGMNDRKLFEEQARELFARFGFQDPRRILDSYPFQLSGGMQQRVGVVAAMLLRPKILLADEPTSALDVTVQKQVIEEMLLVREMFGTAILLVTHNMGVLRAMADKFLVMRDGRMVEYGEAGEVLEHPQAPYTKQLLAAVPKLRR